MAINRQRSDLTVRRRTDGELFSFYHATDVPENYGADQTCCEPGENDPCGECGHSFEDHGDRFPFPRCPYDTEACYHGSGSGNRCPCREFEQREED